MYSLFLQYSVKVSPHLSQVMIHVFDRTQDNIDNICHIVHQIEHDRRNHLLGIHSL